jgi:amidase
VKTITAGFTSPTDDAPHGVPIGLEFLGQPWKDHELLDIAQGFEDVLQARKVPIFAFASQ